MKSHFSNGQSQRITFPSLTPPLILQWKEERKEKEGEKQKQEKEKKTAAA